MPTSHYSSFTSSISATPTPSNRSLYTSVFTVFFTFISISSSCPSSLSFPTSTQITSFHFHLLFSIRPTTFLALRLSPFVPTYPSSTAHFPYVFVDELGDYYANLTHLIEASYNTSKKPAIVVAHSLGNMVTIKFLPHVSYDM